MLSVSESFVLEREELVYLPRESGGSVFCHMHFPENSNGYAVVYMNPIFDEKERVQRMQVGSARSLVKLGYTVARFDYFGSGDSSGDNWDFRLVTCRDDLAAVLKYLNLRSACQACVLVGIRLGADLSLQASQYFRQIQGLVLIEPMISGKKYLSELRLRRKLFHKLNNITQTQVKYEIEGVQYEDFQGYLIDSQSIEFLLEIEQFWQCGQFPQVVKVLSVVGASSARLFSKLECSGRLNRQFSTESVQAPIFWSQPYPLDITRIQDKLVAGVVESTGLLSSNKNSGQAANE